MNGTLPNRRPRSGVGRIASSGIDSKKTGYTISDANPRRQRGCLREGQGQGLGARDLLLER